MESEHLSLPPLGVQQEHQDINSQNIYREPRSHPYRFPDYRLRLCDSHETWLIDSAGIGHVVSFTPLTPTVFLLSLLWDSLSSASCLAVDLCMCSHQLLDEASLMLIMLGSCLQYTRRSLAIISLMSFCQSYLVLA